MARRGDSYWLRTTAEFPAVQPLAAYHPLAARTTIAGRVEGVGVLRITDGGGRVVRVEIDGGGAPEGIGRPFELTLGELHEARERLAAEGIVVRGDTAAFTEPIPRLILELSAPAGAGPAWWTDLEGRVHLPCPSEEELRAEILALLRGIVELWDEHLIDHENGFARFIQDVVTGERLYTRGGGLHPAFSLLVEATWSEPEPRWIELNERFLESWFAHCFNPETGLPRMWNPKRREGRDNKPMEVFLPLDFLHDLAEKGPERWREPALAQAKKIGEHVLGRGVLPDGQVSGGYRPGDGEPFHQYPHLRRLDAPAQLARLGTFHADPRFLEVARDAVITFEYTWLWPGTWDAVDPGLDDNYGHYERGRRLYAELPRSQRAGQCANCGECERRCPNGLPIRTKLAAAHRALG